MEKEGKKMLGQKVDERRKHERLPIMLTASLTFEGQSLAVTIFDISGGGAKIRVDGAVIPTEDKIKSPVVLDVPSCGELEGKIVWKDDEYFGLGFDESHSKLISILIN